MDTSGKHISISLPDALLELSDEDLASATIDQLDTALETLNADWDALVLALPGPVRAVQTLFKLDYEVKNGGFHQYFTNTCGKFDDVLSEDIGALGDSNFQGVVQSAVEEYQTHDYSEQWRNMKRGGPGSWERFTAPYKEGRFKEVDQNYYAIEPGMMTLIGRYVRKHFADFQSVIVKAPETQRHHGPSKICGECQHVNPVHRVVCSACNETLEDGMYLKMIVVCFGFAFAFHYLMPGLSVMGTSRFSDAMISGLAILFPTVFGWKLWLKIKQPQRRFFRELTALYTDVTDRLMVLGAVGYLLYFYTNKDFLHFFTMGDDYHPIDFARYLIVFTCSPLYLIIYFSVMRLNAFKFNVKNPLLASESEDNPE